MGVLGVLLAAGTGSRFEAGNKLLAGLCGQPVVVRAALTLADAGDVDDLVAVIGHEGDRVADALADLPFETVENPDYAAGQTTSVARGARVATDRGADAAVFTLGDLPQVSTDTVTALVATWRDADAGIVVPTQGGRRGNPVLFDRRHFEDLRALAGDTGGRELFEANPVERVPVEDPGIHEDVDTVADLDELRADCE